MNLPAAPAQYSQIDQMRTRVEIAQQDKHNVKRNTDIDMGTQGARVIIHSPNGTAYKLSVDNSGVLSAVLVP